jgi:hypothetical protein
MVAPISPDNRTAGPRPYASRLWAAGCATAAVAFLIALAGAAVSRAVFDVSLVAADIAGLGWSTTATVAAGSALIALVLTGVLHALLAAVPRPVAYFEWIVALVGVVLVFAPFAYDAPRGSQVATSVVSGLVMVAIGSLLGTQGALIDRGRARAGR